MSLFRVPQIWRSKDLDYFTSRASLDSSDLFRSSPSTVKSEVVQERFALRRSLARTSIIGLRRTLAPSETPSFAYQQQTQPTGL